MKDTPNVLAPIVEDSKYNWEQEITQQVKMENNVQDNQEPNNSMLNTSVNSCGTPLVTNSHPGP